MNRIKKLCFILGGFFSTAALVVAIIAFQVKPTLTPEYLDKLSTAIESQSTDITQLRNIAEKEHAVVIQSFKTLDSAIELFLIFMALSAIGFFYVGFYALKH